MVFSGYFGFVTNKTERHDITEILLKVVLKLYNLALILISVDWTVILNHHQNSIFQLGLNQQYFYMYEMILHLKIVSVHHIIDF